MIKETVSWIIDGIDKRDCYNNSIDFVHSFGMKCDCVGWCTMKLESQKDLDLLQKIGEQARQKHGHLRCFYEKQYYGMDTEWYLLAPTKKCDADWEFDESVRQDFCQGIRGFRLSPQDHLVDLQNCGYVAVSEKFVSICEKYHFTGVHFAWLRDIGKYQALPYYLVIPENHIPEITNDGDKFGINFHKAFRSKKSADFRRHMKLCRQADFSGGHLSLVSECVDKIQMASIPIMISEKKTPKADFCYYRKDTYEHGILIRKEVAQILKKEKMIQDKDMIPVLYFDEIEQASLVQEGMESIFLPEETIAYWNENREKWQAKQRPAYQVNEAIALKRLRAAKRERPEDFTKPMPKKMMEQYSNTRVEMLLPVYRVSDGGFVSDEIELCKIEEVQEETKQWEEEMREEEVLLEEKPEWQGSLCIGHTMNGDDILLLPDGKVLRYDHEDPYLSEEWTNVWQFLFDNI